MCLDGLRSSQNAGKLHSESIKVGANHSCKILDPPLLLPRQIFVSGVRQVTLQARLFEGRRWRCYVKF